MSSTHTITLLKPDGTGSFTGKPMSWQFTLNTEDAGVAVADYSISYATLTDAYENGKIAYTRNAGASQKLFEGKILKVERVQDMGTQRIRMQFIDMKAALERTVAGSGTSNLVSVTTETLDIANRALSNDGIPDTDDGFKRFFPSADTANSAPSSSSPWVAITSTDYAPLANFDGNQTSGDTELVTNSTVDQLFPPRGILWTSFSNYTTNIEYVWYDGYAADPGNGGKYTFYNCVRGALGTTPALKNNGYIIGLRAVKPFNTDTQIAVEGTDGTWHFISQGNWRPNQELGCIEFHGDLTTAPFSYTSFRYSGTHYDVDNAAAATVNSVVQAMMEYPIANGGPGRTVTTHFTVAFPRIWILEDFGNDAPIHTKTMIDRIIETYEPYANIGRGLWYWYNPTNSKWEFKYYSQASSPDLDLSSIKPKRINEKYNTHNLDSSVLVPYRPMTASMNLLSPTRSWHPAIGATAGDGAVAVSALRYMYADLANAAGWNRDTVSTGDTTIHNTLVLNGNPNSGAGIEFATNPGTNVYAFDFWFPNVASYEIGTISWCVDFRNWLNPGQQCGVNIFAMDAYTPHATTPTRGNLTHLAGWHLVNGVDTPSGEGFGMALGGNLGNDWGQEGII